MHQRSQGSRHLQSRSAKERATIFLQNPGSTPNPQVPQRAGTPENLLPQARRSRPGTASHRKNVCLKHPFLNVKQFCRLAEFVAEQLFPLLLLKINIFSILFDVFHVTAPTVLSSPSVFYTSVTISFIPQLLNT